MGKKNRSSAPKAKPSGGKLRISMRLPQTLIDSIRATARAEQRSISNFIDLFFSTRLTSDVADIEALQAPIEEARSALVAFRLSRANIDKLDKMADRLARTRSDLCARLLSGSAPLWRMQHAADTAPQQSESPDIFA